MRVWVLTDGKIGDRVQCIGVAERLGLAYEERVVSPNWLYTALMPFGPIPPADRPDRPGSPIEGPFPPLVIASGRRTVAYVRALRTAAGAQTLTVFMKDPRTGSGAADLIWVPEHDRLRGPNVLTTPTAPHRLTPAALAAARADPPAPIGALPGPRLGVVLGGLSGGVTWSAADIDVFVRRLIALADEAGSVMVTPSRRSPPALKAGVAAALAGRPHWMWDMEGENPYVAILGAADALLVTGDSHNMVGEALATAVPVHVHRPRGLARKLNGFLDDLMGRALILSDQEPLGRTPRAPIDTTGRIADAIAKLAAERGIRLTP